MHILVYDVFNIKDDSYGFFQDNLCYTNPTTPPSILTNKKGVCKSIVGFCQAITLYNSKATQMACGINNNTLKRWYIGSFFP